jgi:hypothetical protein
LGALVVKNKPNVFYHLIGILNLLKEYPIKVDLTPSLMSCSMPISKDNTLSKYVLSGIS